MLAGNILRICATGWQWVCERGGYYGNREVTINGNVGDIILVMTASAEETNKAITDFGFTAQVEVQV